MIDRTNVRKIFEELDHVMSEKGRKDELVIFGSAALISLGLKVGDRVTRDVDVVKPPLDREMSTLVASAGKKFGLEAKWLNTDGRVFLEDIPPGWEERTTEVFSGKSLKIHSLGRTDLICTKLDAFCDRGIESDRRDLMILEPNQDELEDAAQWMISRGHLSQTLIRSTVDEIVKRLKIHGRDFGR